MQTTAQKIKRVATQQAVVDGLTRKVEAHKAGLADAQQMLKLAGAELTYRKSAPTFDPDDPSPVAAPVVKTPVIPTQNASKVGKLDDGKTEQVPLPEVAAYVPPAADPEPEF